MKFYKSFLFLFGLNFLFIFPVWLFLDLRFLIPVFVFLLFLNLFFLFFITFYLRKFFSFSSFPPEDPYGAYLIFEDLKNSYNLNNIQLLKIKRSGFSLFYFGNGYQFFVVLSEELLESVSKEELKCLLSYPFQMILSGDLAFLTLLSGFLFLMEKLLYLLNYPLFSFKKNPDKKENLTLIFILKVFSLITKNIFYRRDKNLFSDKDKKSKKKQALALWKLDSLTTVKPPKVFPFMASLFLTNPLTDSTWQCYISLQPLIKGRVISLMETYPP